MKSINSPARTISLIGLSILVHGAAFWAFSENITLKKMTEIVSQAHDQMNHSEMWEPMAQKTEVQVVTSADEVSDTSSEEVTEKKFEFKKVESVTKPKTAAVKATPKKKKTEEIATTLPEKVVVEEQKSEIPTNTVTVAATPEPESLEPDVEMSPTSHWITQESPQANTVETVENTDLLGELRAHEEIEKQAIKTRSYLDLRQASGNRPPQYPLEARKMGLQGRVILKYFVTDKGSVQDVQVSESSGHKVLDDEALRAISSYRFYPGQEGWAEHPVKFSLSGLKSEIPSDLGASAN